MAARDPRPTPVPDALQRVAETRRQRRAHCDPATLTGALPAIGTLRRAILERVAALDPGGGPHRPRVSERRRFRALIIATYGHDAWREYAALWGYSEDSGMPT